MCVHIFLYPRQTFSTATAIKALEISKNNSPRVPKNTPETSICALNHAVEGYSQLQNENCCIPVVLPLLRFVRIHERYYLRSWCDSGYRGDCPPRVSREKLFLTKTVIWTARSMIMPTPNRRGIVSSGSVSMSASNPKVRSLLNPDKTQQGQNILNNQDLAIFIWKLRISFDDVQEILCSIPMAKIKFSPLCFSLLLYQ